MANTFLRDVIGRIFKKNAAPISYSASQEGAVYNNNNSDMRIQIAGADRAIVTDTQTQTLSGKGIDGLTNTVTNIGNASIAAGVDAVKIANGSVSNTEFQYLDGVTSAIQTQIDGKQATGNYVTALTGDVSASGPGSVAATLATVNSNVGSFGTATQVATITANAKGLVTAVSNTTIQIAESQVTNLVSDLAGKQATGSYITALTGDVTASGPNSVAATIAANAVTNAKAAQMATQTIKGRTTAGTGNAEDLTATQATAILNAFVGDSGSGGTKGLVIAPATGDATKFLKGDGTWASPSGSGSYVEIFNVTVTSAMVANGYLHFKAPAALTFQTVAMQIFEKNGVATGSLTIDIKKGTNPGTMTTIFTTKPTLNFATAADYDSDAGTQSVTTCSSGDYLRLDITAIPVWAGSFQVRFYGTV